MRLAWRDTYLIRRDEGEFVFLCEISALLKGLIAVILIMLFILTLEADFSRTLWFRGGVLLFAAIAVAGIGSKQKTVIAPEEGKLQLQRRFFFFSRRRETELARGIQVISEQKADGTKKEKRLGLKLPHKDSKGNDKVYFAYSVDHAQIEQWQGMLEQELADTGLLQS